MVEPSDPRRQSEAGDPSSSTDPDFPSEVPGTDDEPETPSEQPGEGPDEEQVDPPIAQSELAGVQVRVPERVDPGQIAHFVTTIKNAEQQVGENIIRALQHEDTVAVLTTVTMAPDGQQRVISAALNPNRLQQVQEILMAAEEEREEEEPCVGFHCLVKPKPSKQ